VLGGHHVLQRDAVAHLEGRQRREVLTELALVAPVARATNALVPGDAGALRTLRYDPKREPVGSPAWAIVLDDTVAGLVDELAALRARHALTLDLPSMRCVGYRQAWELLDGRIDVATFRARAIAATRQLAKRQHTWLRATTATAFDPTLPRLDDAIFEALARGGLRPA